MALDIFVLTLFPQMFTGVFGESMMKRAFGSGAANIEYVDFRQYATDKHHTVDDTPFGGGAGMLLKPEPLFAAMDDIERRYGHIDPPVGRVILLSPQGRRFTQDVAREYAACDRLTFLCGHYEGFDDRVRQHLVTEELSLGDFVMTGGEVAAMAVIEAVVRLLPGVLGNAESLADESHSNGLLEYPQYTRPASFRGMDVPQTLLSGNHQLIAKWRERHALYRTWRERPDLLAQVPLSQEQQEWLERFERGDFSEIDLA
ncbi:tRNA (guanosine(37)-N1)-methyltransferase TrmD [Alicyclobacillus dauci]|uniref:tRNA (guanine-N(1)-)-methyltransferase n=1 Tax=Alicyclobacillus dauci TaxID=1475485 RepID=A0ABY6YYX2_9BACL|nr:tRNA (guanosine(37)-N1)-methyltransferase TrmD [Alicyclobacillus dauci]WAH35463.1 tRNA (guanosine(37)-N1)-methyltransferase TrmD [Alicyclobacillus dauci]